MHLSQSCVRFWYMSHFVGTATAICRSHDRLLLEIVDTKMFVRFNFFEVNIIKYTCKPGMKKLVNFIRNGHTFNLIWLNNFLTSHYFFLQNRCLAEINGFQQLYLHVLVDIIIVCKTLIFKLHHTLFNLYRLRFSSEH